MSLNSFTLSFKLKAFRYWPLYSLFTLVTLQSGPLDFVFLCLLFTMLSSLGKDYCCVKCPIFLSSISLTLFCVDILSSCHLLWTSGRIGMQFLCFNCTLKARFTKELWQWDRNGKISSLNIGHSSLPGLTNCRVWAVLLVHGQNPAPEESLSSLVPSCCLWFICGVLGWVHLFNIPRAHPIAVL